jgi:hypothetical protein
MFHIQQLGDWVECTLQRVKHHLQQVKYHLQQVKHHLQRAKHHLQQVKYHYKKGECNEPWCKKKCTSKE